MINTILLYLVKRTERQQRTFGHIPLNIEYIGTIAIQINSIYHVTNPIKCDL